MVATYFFSTWRVQGEIPVATLKAPILPSLDGPLWVCIFVFAYFAEACIWKTEIKSSVGTTT